MTESNNNPENWRELADQLTPAQVRHLDAIERLALENIDSTDAGTRATAQETLDSLPGEAAWYASTNGQPGAGVQ